MGPECLGGGEDVVTYEKKLWWLQLLRDFHCTVTSTWVDAENLGECHTWRAWGSRVRKKQLDYIMGPRDLVFKTWYLNKTRIRTWDHFPVVVKIEGREMRVRKGKKVWAGWTPVSENEERKFQERCLCPDGSRSCCDANEVQWPGGFAGKTGRCCRGGQGYYVEIRELSSMAAQCRDPVKRRVLRRKAQKARREFDARVGALPRGKVVKKPVVTKIWVDGRG